MGNCKLVEELNRLRKSSSDSIDGIDDFDEFKKYMHVSRQAETDLVKILNKVNESGKKTLVLLCGSAGDGKSHLLSYLKNKKNLLNGYTVYNDATESSAPSKTAIETLSEALSRFSDENLDLPGKNFILAINLGVLSNFIESSYGKTFTKLRNYVMENNILTNQLNINDYDVNSSFQHISFSDYHMFTLTEKGINPNYLQGILDKVFITEKDNPFYNTYKSSCKHCSLSEKCPTKHNFEFLTERKNRSYIANALGEVIIKNKEILTTREVLNYIYDIVVAQRFNYKEIAKSSINEVTFLKKYIRDIMPSLMYEYDDVSALLNQLREFDPLLNRSEQADEYATFYYVSSNVENYIIDVIKDTSYEKVLCQKTSINKINNDKILKREIFNILVRVSDIQQNHNNESTSIYSEFLKYLYYYNAGIKKKLGKLYALVEKAIVQWCGSESKDSICFDDLHHGITLYEHIDFDPYLDNFQERKKDEELQKFLPFIIIKYENKKNKEIISLNIDYSLYELVYKLANGYIQTADDRNNHADFISFVQKILKTGHADEVVEIVTEENYKAIIEKTKFGTYKFKVVK